MCALGFMSLKKKLGQEFQDFFSEIQIIKMSESIGHYK